MRAGAFKYAEAVLDNHMSVFVRRGGSVMYHSAKYLSSLSPFRYRLIFRGRYRGLQMQSQGRTLTLLALYHSYTGDPTGLLLKHYNKTAGIIEMLNKRRARALLLPKSDYAWGMPTGNDEADEGVTTFSCMNAVGDDDISYPNGTCVTELP